MQLTALINTDASCCLISSLSSLDLVILLLICCRLFVCLFEVALRIRMRGEGNGKGVMCHMCLRVCVYVIVEIMRRILAIFVYKRSCCMFCLLLLVHNL